MKISKQLLNEMSKEELVLLMNSKVVEEVTKIIDTISKESYRTWDIKVISTEFAKLIKKLEISIDYNK